MPTVRFTGIISPSGPQIKLHGGPYIWKDPTLGTAALNYSITGSAVDAECEVENTEPKTIHIVHIWAFHLIRSAIDAIAFSKGIGLTLILDRCILPGDREPRPIAFRDDRLAELCTVSTEELLNIADKELAIYKHLHDIADSLINPLEASVNCARAVEGLARLISSETNKARRWQEMREKLNLSKDYLMFITALSTEDRHGDTGPQNLREIGEVQTRAWTVAARFLEFRKRGNVQLPTAEFPEL